MSGVRLGTLFQSFFSTILGLAIALYTNWRLGLVGACFVPLVFIGARLQATILTSQQWKERVFFAESARLVIESFNNIRTVAGLRKEESFVKRYIELITVPHKSLVKRMPFRGLVFGFAQSVPFFAYATCMYYGGYLVKYEGLHYSHVFR